MLKSHGMEKSDILRYIILYDINKHKEKDIPRNSFTFQYGYTTNKLFNIINEM